MCNLNEQPGYVRGHKFTMKNMLEPAEIDSNCMCHIPPPSPDILQKFISIKDQMERFHFVNQYRENYQHSPVFHRHEKSDLLAISEIGHGDAKMSDDDPSAALQFYTTSIALASSKPILAVAYVARSSALEAMMLPKECEEDCNRALRLGVARAIEDTLKTRKKKTSTMPQCPPYYDEIPIIPEADRNLGIPSAKNCIKLVKDSKYGTSFIATRKIDIGEVLVVEESFALYLDNSVKHHCQECLELCYNPIPCTTCSSALYCSEKCRYTAKTSHHKYECLILPTMMSHCIPEYHLLSLRIVLSRKSNLMRQYFFDPPDKILTPIKIFYMTLSITLMHSIVKNHTNFFDVNMEESTFISLLTWLLIYSGIKFGHSCELAPVEGKLMMLPLASVAFNVTPVFRHSCFHNVDFSYYGKTLVVRANRTIQPGEHCCFSYGPKFYNMEKSLRQDSLREHFSFQCTCQACVEDWPSYYSSKLQANPEYQDITMFLDQLHINSRVQVNNLLPDYYNQFGILIRQGISQASLSYWYMIRMCFAYLGNTRFV